MGVRLNTTRTRVAVIDIDMTIADCSHRLKHIEGEEKDWDVFYKLAHYDTPMKDHITFIKRYLKKNKLKPVFVTGRNSDIRDDTEDFLNKYGFKNYYVKLEMRHRTDREPAYIVKQDHLKNILKQYAVEAVFDDDEECLKMYQDELDKYAYGHRVFCPTPKENLYKHIKSPFLLYFAGELWEYKKYKKKEEWHSLGQQHTSG